MLTKETSQRILPHVSQELTLSSCGALVAPTENSTRPVTVRVTEPGLAVVVQYDLRTPLSGFGGSAFR